jgi:hypothetical protein
MTRYIALASVLLFLRLGSTASADIIVDMPANVPHLGIVSEAFTDDPMSSRQGFDDFTLASKYVLTSLRVYGLELGNRNQNVTVTAQFRAAANVSSPVLMSFTGSESGNDLLFDLGGAPLGPGKYWISAIITRPENGGLWLWDLHRPVTGSQAMWQNPGGAASYGTHPITVGTFQGTDPDDLAFRLEGYTSTSTVPAPPAVVLVGLGAGCVALRRYVGRRRVTA